MKLILFVVAIGVLLWLIRGVIRGRGEGDRPASGAAPAEAAPPQAIVACAQCGVHLPRDEALPGKGGVFCGDAHRMAFEKERASGS